MPVPIIAAALIASAAGAGTAVAVHQPKKLKNIGEKKKTWLDAFIAAAKPVCEKNGVPYQMCVAQAALESGWGAAAPKFNHFGIKGEGSAGSQEFSSKEFLNGKWIQKKMKFAAYKSLEDAIQGYCTAMRNNPNFKYATEHFANDLGKFTTWIWGRGYATAPTYVQTVFGVVRTIYNATGNPDFDFTASKEILNVVKKLQKVAAGPARSTLTQKLLTA